ncbi:MULTISPECIES: hypothetical protein [Catenuloplanes]|uniref:Uncharacterized protein n=1 Tax=Catenuloplanes niger TaxID=587534 RepID=A0AAE4CSW4_9ACTN|nr:hypothetical protein [Catenuloplanes niger]MDR7322752.1 hypothetical protein [Catenuloplanes niger]
MTSAHLTERTSAARPGHAIPSRRRTEQAGFDLPAWPVAGLLLLYPLWWALGLGVLIFPILAVPMVVLLIRGAARGRPVRMPPGFAWWLLFLTVVVVSIGALGADPAGTVPERAGARIVGVAFRLAQYASLTVLLVYAGNLTERELPRRRLVGLLGWLFVVTVAGGLLGVFAGHFAFTSPVEMVLPAGVRNKGFVQSMVHPYAAQIMDVVGESRPRPAAPWGYTNTWGNNFCLLVGFFVVSSAKHRLLAVLCLLVALVPVVESLNRGLWIGLGVSVLYVALRSGRIALLLGVLAAGALLVLVVLVSPLGGTVTARLDNGKSDGVRSFLVGRALDGVVHSPVIGYGSTRTTIGGRNSIAVGESSGCERCGNFTVGGNGQLWQLLYAHGLTGTIAYFGFFVHGLWRFRRDRSPTGLAASCAIVASFVATLWYNALVTPLAFLFLAYALLWRNQSSEGDPT